MFCLFICACGNNHNAPDIEGLVPYSWDLLDSGIFHVDDLGANKATVIITMDPECPMCANYSKTINELVPRFKPDSVQFYGLFTTKYYSQKEIRRFKLKYGMDIPFILDPTNRLALFLGAEVTPEVFVFDRALDLKYHGLIDDWAIALGKKRKEAKNHYLSDVLTAIGQGLEPDIPFTQAVGCIIEYDIE